MVQTEAEIYRSIEPDESPIWSLRGVSTETRTRIKVRAVMLHRNVPELVDLACRFWLANGTPDETEMQQSVADPLQPMGDYR